MTSPADLPARLRANVTEAALRLIAGAFRRDGEQLSSDRRPRFSIPTRPTEDDDCVVIDGLKEAAARIEVLEAALRALLACEYESASHGLLDCIDNDGGHYQSAHLAKCIADAEILLAPEHPNDQH